MVSPSQIRLQKDFRQVYYDQRLKDILFFVSKNRSLSTKEVATLGIAEKCKQLLEQLEQSNNFGVQARAKLYKTLVDRLITKYSSLKGFQYPIKE